MNLFNYLMAKKGHNTSVRNDLFSYLLGKGIKEHKIVSGTTINITDVTEEKINSLKLDKESTQDGTPTPDNPVEVETVKGYRNELEYFDNINQTVGVCKWKSIGDGYYKATGKPTTQANFNTVKLSHPYTIKEGDYLHIGNDKIASASIILILSNGTSSSPIFSSINRIFSLSSRVGLTITGIAFSISTSTPVDEVIFRPMILNTNNEKPYVPYGNNYVYTKVTNGTDTNYYPIPLNNNEIVGKGNNLDKLIVDKTGHCYINKVFAKIDSYNGETITTDYWSTTGGLDTGATIYYVLDTPQLINLNYIVDIRLFVGNSEITNSDNMNMILEYY